MTAPAKAKTRNLERVRVNQQRSRERKRQYTAELEKKVKQLESSLREHGKSSDGDGKLAKLSHENRVRSDLLSVLGIDKETQDRFVRAAVSRSDSLPTPAQLKTGVGEDRGGNAAISEASQPPVGEEEPHANTLQEATFALPPTTAGRSAEPNNVHASSYQIETFQETQPSIFQPDFAELLTAFSTTNALLETPSPQASPIEDEMPAQNRNSCSNCSCCLSPNSPDMDPSFPSDSTTACSIAFSMVLQNNKRGYEFIDLESRMRVGYRNGTSPGQECRILNKVLFGVLAEIT